MWWLVRRGRAAWYLAPLAYVAAKVAGTLLLFVAGAVPVSAWSALPASLVAALPGLGVLIGVSLVLARLYPRSAGARTDDAAGV